MFNSWMVMLPFSVLLLWTAHKGFMLYDVLSMIIIGTRVHLMYSGDISSTEIVIIAYVLMLFVFAAGFVYQWLRRKP